jgi:uncharacterized protein YkwD
MGARVTQTGARRWSLRLGLTAGTLAAAGVAFPVATGGVGQRADAAHATARTSLTSTEARFLDGINQVRADHAESGVSVDVRLVVAARGHSRSMVAGQYFAHGTFATRIEREGVTTGRVGETLAWTAKPQGAVGRIVDAWLESPEHRRILLDGGYRQVGIGVATGRFEGYPDAVVVTADFHAN